VSQYVATRRHDITPPRTASQSPPAPPSSTPPRVCRHPPAPPPHTEPVTKSTEPPQVGNNGAAHPAAAPAAETLTRPVEKQGSARGVIAEVRMTTSPPAAWNGGDPDRGERWDGSVAVQPGRPPLAEAGGGAPAVGEPESPGQRDARGLVDARFA
jgi:hypothetical protein